MVNSVKEGIPISVALDKQQPDAQAASASTAPYYSSWDSGETEPVTPWSGDPAPQAAEPGPTWGPVLREIVETIVLTLVTCGLAAPIVQSSTAYIYRSLNGQPIAD